jgi:hypothetical protein
MGNKDITQEHQGHQTSKYDGHHGQGKPGHQEIRGITDITVKTNYSGTGTFRKARSGANTSIFFNTLIRGKYKKKLN